MRQPDSLVEWEVSICAQTRVEFDLITYFGLVRKLMSQLNCLRECGASLRSGERDGRAGRESGTGERGGRAGRECRTGERGGRTGRESGVAGAVWTTDCDKDCCAIKRSDLHRVVL